MSLVVVAHDMARELPRTLRTLSADYQHDPGDYEVIVVDNGSPEPIASEWLDAVPNGRLLRLDPAPPSPVRAADTGLAEARGDLIGLFIDGARMVSPGMVRSARQASRLGSRTVIAAPAYHLGDETQMTAASRGYDQAAEDRLLASVDWLQDGDQLFTISTLAGSSHRGWFGPLGESNSLFLPRALWRELGGLDEAFDRPGGGLANHDVYRRACELPDVDLVMLLGEGTFHQYHGGAATGKVDVHRELWNEYERIRGRPHQPPTLEPTYLGRVPPHAAAHLSRSATWFQNHHAAD